MPPTERGLITPAHISYFTIYNPTLSRSDETLSEQIVFYYSQTEQEGHSRNENGGRQGKERNERLRQIGLAQGMVAFARNFSDHEIDTVETDQGRLILKELEHDWWILVSIDFTRICSPTDSPASGTTNLHAEYSSREISPAHLLLQQLLKAHSIFLLHHGASLAELYQRFPKDFFSSLLERFWTNFIWNWDILLHGNPAVDLFNGLKVCDSGELGFGVGEEEWGSGERDVLEDLVSRTDGLVDIVASRFGDAPQTGTGDRGAHDSASLANRGDGWLGRNDIPSSTDGVFFSGVGAMTKQSVIQISRWMEWIFRFGEDAYGVRRDPLRRRRLSKARANHKEEHRAHPPASQNRRESHASSSLTPNIPPPLIAITEPTSSGSTNDKRTPSNERNTPPPRGRQPSLPDALNFSADALMKVLTLGYGSAWGNSSTSNEVQEASGNESEIPKTPSGERSSPTRNENGGHFILGLKGNLSIEHDGDRHAEHRILLRRLNVSLKDADADQELTAVVYVRQPFMFTFLFEPSTEALKSSSLYRDFHHQLAPLWKPLLASTSPREFTNHAQFFSFQRNRDPNSQPLYDVIFDRENQVVHSNLPNIPDAGVPATTQISRSDALNIHTQILQTYLDTRNSANEFERTIKTNRNWWILWLRMEQQSNTGDGNGDLDMKIQSCAKEAFLVRRAVDNASGSMAVRSTRILRDMGGPGVWTGPMKLAEIGLDARRYVESLLDFNR